MDCPAGHELSEFAQALIHSRQNVLPRRLTAPGPTAPQLQAILAAAAAAPDHGRLLPWRFVIVPTAQRQRLAEVFALALQQRDPEATAAQLDNAREKAYRAPFLMLAIVRLADGRAAPSAASPPAHESSEAPVRDAERMVSFGCAIQNVLLSAHAAGFGAGLTSGQAMESAHLRTLFALQASEHAVCCINIGTVTQHKPARLRPQVSDYVTTLA